MMIVIDLMLLILFCLLISNFGIYSLLLKLIARFRNVDHTIDTDHNPSVTVLIAAYNEGDFLRQKLENSLALDYPGDRLNIVLVSDGSTDNTNDIAREFESRGITVIIAPENKGKATALNTGMDVIDTDIVVLSDANVLYESNVIRKLVRHFSDPSIGSVSGKVVLLNDELSYSDAENTYYSIEHTIQQLESQTGNLIGADGAMYAIRRELFRPLQSDTLLDDFVLSMGVIQQGKRLIFDPEAMGFEKNLAEIDSEYNRKVRIIAGGMQSLQRKTSWPPKDQKLTAVKYFFHKIIRWIIGPVLIAFVVLLLIKGIITGNSITLALALAALILSPALLLTMKLFPSLQNFKPIGLCNYLLVMASASVVGCYKALISRQRISWR